MLSDIQKRLDTSPWDRSNHALVPDFKNLDLTQQGELIFVSDLEWRQVHSSNKDRRASPLRALLFKEFIVLLKRLNPGQTPQQVRLFAAAVSMG